MGYIFTKIHRIVDNLVSVLNPCTVTSFNPAYMYMCFIEGVVMVLVCLSPKDYTYRKDEASL